MKLWIRQKSVLAVVIFFAVIAGFLLTWGPIFMGYEKETALSALSFWQGDYQIFRSGLAPILLYQPFISFGSWFFPNRLEAILTLVPVFYSAATAVIVFLIFEKITQKISVSILLSLLVAFGSLLWPYSRIGMEYPATFFLCLLALSLLFWQEKRISSIVVGAILALAVLSKSYGLLFVLPTTVFILLAIKQQGQIRQFFSSEFLVKLFGFTLLGLATILALNHKLYGQWQGIYFLRQEFQIWSFWEGWFGTFFSFGKSLFLYSPLLLISVFYWPAFARKFPALFGFILTAFLALLLITAPFSFWSDETLSVRKLMPIVPLLHLPLFLAFQQKFTPLENANDRVGGNKSDALGRWLFKATIGSLTGFTSWFKAFCFGIIIVLALYFQLINSLYPYWRQLEFLRPYNLDNLPTMRYNAKLSHLSLNNKFFLSLAKNRLTGKSGNFFYQERSWMRCCTYPKEADKTLTRINVSLSAFERPDTYLFKQSALLKTRKIFAFLDVGALILLGSLLMANYFYHGRLENQKE